MEEQSRFKGHYFPLAFYDVELSLEEKHICIEIDAFSRGGKCYVSNKHFAKRFFLSTNRVSKIISGLKEKRIISVELVYEENSKEIKERILRLIDERILLILGNIEVLENKPIGVLAKMTIGIGKNDKENNKSNNIINNKNISSSECEVKKKKEKNINQVSLETDNVLNLYQLIFNYWNNKSNTTEALVKHKDLNDKIKKSIDRCKKELKLKTIDDYTILIDRFIEIYEYSKTTNYPITKRPLYEFFGQKAYKCDWLICSEYQDDGSKWLRYNEQNKNLKNILTNKTESINIKKELTPFELEMEKLKEELKQKGEI